MKPWHWLGGSGRKLASGAVLLAAVSLGAGSLPALPRRQPLAPAPAAVPFGVGEVMSYKMSFKWGIIGGGGDASLRVEAMDTIHGHAAYRLGFYARGSLLALFKVNNGDRSWLDEDELFARRFEQKHSDGRDRTYDFLPGEMRYVNIVNPEDAGDLASDRPLDDVSFLYHVRTLPLTPDAEYQEPRYYKQEGNPVTVRVLRTERVKVPAGEFDAIVVRPVIRTRGLFKEDGQAEVWFSNDERRLVLKLRAKASRGTLTMELQSYTPGATAGGS
jgi:hypothetical protein